MYRYEWTRFLVKTTILYKNIAQYNAVVTRLHRILSLYAYVRSPMHFTAILPSNFRRFPRKSTYFWISNSKFNDGLRAICPGFWQVHYSALPSTCGFFIKNDLIRLCLICAKLCYQFYDLCPSLPEIYPKMSSGTDVMTPPTLEVWLGDDRIQLHLICAKLYR